MKKSYQSLSTSVLTLKTGILCASGGGPSLSAPKGGLEPIGKGTGEW